MTFKQPTIAQSNFFGEPLETNRRPLNGIRHAELARRHRAELLDIRGGRKPLPENLRELIARYGDIRIVSPAEITVSIKEIGK